MNDHLHLAHFNFSLVSNDVVTLFSRSRSFLGRRETQLHRYISSSGFEFFELLMDVIIG